MTVEEPREFVNPDGSRWLRTGYCSHCGECCFGCPLHGLVAMRCNGYGGDEYRGYGCDTYPDATAKLHPSCTYQFERVT